MSNDNSGKNYYKTRKRSQRKSSIEKRRRNQGYDPSEEHINAHLHKEKEEFDRESYELRKAAARYTNYKAPKGSWTDDNEVIIDESYKNSRNYNQHKLYEHLDNLVHIIHMKEETERKIKLNMIDDAKEKNNKIHHSIRLIFLAIVSVILIMTLIISIAITQIEESRSKAIINSAPSIRGSATDLTSSATKDNSNKDSSSIVRVSNESIRF